MAGDKKEKVAISPDEHFRRHLIEITILILSVFVIVSIFNNVQSGIENPFASYIERLGFLEPILLTIVSLYIWFAKLLSALLIISIIYIHFKNKKIEKFWKDAVTPKTKPEGEKEAKNEKWQRVLTHIASESPSDWRLAILECDIILDDLLDKIGYIGGTIGDKLKNADKATFRNLDNAWEAHKIRNAIAHEGQDFALTGREARRIIDLYESVFVEFDFI